MDQMELSKLDDAQKRALLAQLLQQKGQRTGPRRAPLSHAQQRMWFIDQMQGGNPVYTIAAALRLTGTLDLSRVQQALDHIAARHEALRTTFDEEDGVPVQVISPAGPLPLERLEGHVETVLQSFHGRAFDLHHGPLIRCALIKESETQHILAIAAHHVIADYRSLQVMISEFVHHCGASDAPLPPLPIQYADYAIWQAGRHETLTAQLAYWRAHLEGLPALQNMPTDYARPAQQSGKGARRSFGLSPDLSRRIEIIAATHEMTPYMVLLALFQLLHHRYCGSRDICIGTTVSNRDRPELQGMIGYFVNTLAMRMEIQPEDSFDTLLQRTRHAVLESMAHNEAPFEQVIDSLDIPRSLSHAPLFQSMFNLHEKQPDQIALPGLTLAPVVMGGTTARFDLSMDMFHGPAFTGVLEYNTDLFTSQTIDRMLAHFDTLIEQTTRHPERRLAQIDILTEEESAQLARANATTAPIPEADLATLIEESAQAHGASREAILCGDRTLSYTALNTAANQLAHHIAPRIGHGDRVAVSMPRSEHMVVALLAVLKLGAVYIPLDPRHPADRLHGVIEESGASLLLCADDRLAPACPVLNLNKTDLSAENDTNPPRTTRGDDLAYIIFTSGTTGRPKGVPICHRSLVNLLVSMARNLRMHSHDTLVAVTTPAFDIAALELFLPLLTGARLVIADAFAVMDDLALAKLLRDTEATMMQATPTTWRLLGDARWQAPVGFKMLCGGEALDLALATRLLQGHGTLWNLYGPTETTIWSACAQITATDISHGVIALGTPIANTTLHVLDAALQPCPPGVAGELYIGGAGLSPGYLNRPELTAQAFVPNPFGAGRLYRTGDNVKQLADGRLIYLGRLDFQVKLRGFRIELAEIEAVMRDVPQIEQALVTLHHDPEDPYLVAYYRATTDADLQPALRAELAHRLPGYLVPGRFIQLDTFPLNANGKIDRAALPQPGSATSPAQTTPSTPTETLIAHIWADLLNQPHAGRETDFFAAGGHSLLAMRVIARLPLAVARAHPLRLLFEHPVLADFAAALDAQDMLDTNITNTPAPIAKRPEDTARVLSYAQSRQWALAQFDPDASAYNLPAAIRLIGPLDLDRLDRALALLCARHDILRSAYPAQSGVASVRTASTNPNLARCRADDLNAQLRAACAQPFDLASGPLLRLSAFHEATDKCVLLLVMHHIISDTLTVQLVLRELVSIYGHLAVDAGFEPARITLQYADFAAWERSQDISAQLDFWQDHLKDAPPLLELATDFAPPAKQNLAGDALRFFIPAEQATALKTLGQAQNATPFMVMLAGFATLLGRFSDMPELVIGTPVTQRPHPDLEGLIGLFVNTLALRLPGTSEDSFTTTLKHVRDVVLSGLTHQDVPFERIIDQLSTPRSPAHNPVFQAMFQWKSQDLDVPDLPYGLQIEPYETGSVSAKVDIALAINDTADGFECRLEYRTDLFRAETIENMATAFRALLANAVAQPTKPVSQLSMLHPDHATTIAAWNETQRIYPATPDTLHDLVSAQATRDGAATAIRDQNGMLSYAQLAARSDTLAAHLQQRGIGRGMRVGIALPRTTDLICAMLAVLKTGAAYVPLDPKYPAERIAYIAQDAQLSMLLSDGAQQDGAVVRLDLSAFWDTTPPATPTPANAGGSDLAYLIYTSGSTGKPKGVALEHRNAVSFIHWAHQTFTTAQLSGVLASTSVCFDLSIFEIFATLAAGGTVLLVDDLFALPDAPFADQVTLINTVPTPMTGLMRLGPLPSNVRTVCLAGEPLPPSLAHAILETGSVDALWNLYGPSEDTTYSTAARLHKGKTVTIGRPISNTRAYVLDSDQQLLPPGVPGELWLAGAGIARGYWQKPEITAERFRPNPFDTDGTAPRMYCTGDRVRQLADGSLSYLGRGDQQLKLRGFRIEPGEVENAILRHPDITGVVVDARNDTNGHARLTAWVETTARSLQPPLQAALAHELPQHMVPTVVVLLDSLPRLPNGKLDRAALPDPQETTLEQNNDPLQGPLENSLAEIWRALLGRADVGRADNFFALGGDSILAIQMVAQVRQQGLRVTPGDIFQYPTIAALAQASAGRNLLPAASGPVQGEVPLGPIQRWFFEQDLPNRAHWNQAFVLDARTPLDPTLLNLALKALATDHDILRARYVQRETGWVQTILPPGDAPELSCSAGNINDAASALQTSFDLENGPLWGAILVDHPGSAKIALAAHHLLVDGVSWRILLADLQAHYHALADTGNPAQFTRSNGVNDWVGYLTQSDVFAPEIPYWRAIDSVAPDALPQDHPGDANLEADAGFVDTLLDEPLTHQLLVDVPAGYPVETPELLVSALLLTFRDWTGHTRLKLDMESHGRPDLNSDIDLSRTVGWLTGLYPVLLETQPAAPQDDVLRAVKETLRALPHNGVGYGVLRYLQGKDWPGADQGAHVRFNYLGQTSSLFDATSLLSPADESPGPFRALENPRDTVFDLNAIVGNGKLRLRWNYPARLYRRETVDALATDFARHLEQLIQHCLSADASGFTPADFPDMDFDQDDLDDLLMNL